MVQHTLNRRTVSKLNRYQRTIDQKERTEYYQQGKGLYVFRNKSGGTLELPKKTSGGMTHVADKDVWQGDDYYMDLVRKNEATVVECLVTPEQETAAAKEKETLMNEEKLLVDQPATVTVEGTVEQVVVNPTQPLVESSPDGTTPKEVLLIEDPMEGVDILMND